ncbi:MAG: hypothetical protein JJT94_05980 [Bernardetiaceae bacterium]|nr:hypothetical protein [Bernardetiaceae bacterium]
MWLRIILIGFLCAFYTLFSTELHAQKDWLKATKIDWLQLSKVNFRTEMNHDVGYKVSVPEFHADVEALDKKKVQIEGYIIPMEIGENYFALSAYPFEVCFFCGQAGPETVMEVYVAEPVRLDKKKIKVEGILYLNRKDANHLIYMLKKAKEVK